MNREPSPEPDASDKRARMEARLAQLVVERQELADLPIKSMTDAALNHRDGEISDYDQMIQLLKLRLGR